MNKIQATVNHFPGFVSGKTICQMHDNFAIFYCQQCPAARISAYRWHLTRNRTLFAYQNAGSRRKMICDFTNEFEMLGSPCALLSPSPTPHKKCHVSDVNRSYWVAENMELCKFCEVELRLYSGYNN